MLFEPTTSLTDLFLSILSFSLGLGMIRRFRDTGARREAFWACGFFALAAATAIGSVIHGYAGFGQFREAVWFSIWVTAAIACGCFLLAAVFAIFAEPKAARLTGPIIVALLALFWQAYIVRDQLAIFQAFCLIPGAVVYGALAWRTGQPRLLAVPAGLAILAAGAALQTLGISFTAVWRFTQNDVFHLAMIAALPWYYAGAAPALLRTHQGGDSQSPRRTPSLPWRQSASATRKSGDL